MRNTEGFARILTASKCTLERELMSDAYSAMVNPAVWKAMPPYAYTELNNAIAFRLLSRSR